MCFEICDVRKPMDCADKCEGRAKNQARFWDEFLKRDVSFLSEYSDDKIKSSFFSQLFETSRSYIEPLCGKKILEIGCGDGMDSIALALNYDCRITAIDISPRRVELARENIKRYGLEGRINAVVADANCLDFGEGEFDGVVGNSVMLFLDHNKACREISRVLKPGDCFVLTNESMPLSPLVNLSRMLGLGYRSRELEQYVSFRLTPASVKELGAKYFSQTRYVVHFGLLTQLLWGWKLLLNRFLGLFKQFDTYHKPEVFCPSILKRVDRFLLEKWEWYHNRAWILAASFIK
jgi:ubiquinone/menaquinone biosynthesis C-methylase UbiE